MKKTITCILLTAGLTGYLSAQTPVQDKSDKNSGKVIRMDKQMFLDNIFDYTSGSTNWKYKGEKPAVIDFYATWCGPCRMVAPLLKSLAKEYKDQIAVYKVDTDKQKELSAVMGIQSLPTIIFIPKTGQPQIIIGAANKATFRKAIEDEKQALHISNLNITNKREGAIIIAPPLSIYTIANCILFLEISVVQTFKTFAVTSFVLSHFVNCIVNSIQVQSFCTSSNAFLVSTST